MAPANDTETAFSDATFDTLSRRSATSDNVVYADVIKPKAWTSESTSDEEHGERDEEGPGTEDQEIQDSASDPNKVRNELTSHRSRVW